MLFAIPLKKFPIAPNVSVIPLYASEKAPVIAPFIPPSPFSPTKTFLIGVAICSLNHPLTAFHTPFAKFQAFLNALCIFSFIVLNVFVTGVFILSLNHPLTAFHTPLTRFHAVLNALCILSFTVLNVFTTGVLI